MLYYICTSHTYRYKMPIVAAGRNQNMIRKCIVSGFFMNAAKKDPQEGYKTVRVYMYVYSVVYIICFL